MDALYFMYNFCAMCSYTLKWIPFVPISELHIWLLNINQYFASEVVSSKLLSHMNFETHNLQIYENHKVTLIMGSLI